MSDILALIQLVAIFSGAGFTFVAFANRTEAGLNAGAGWRGMFRIRDNYTEKGRRYWLIGAASYLIVAVIALYWLLA